MVEVVATGNSAGSDVGSAAAARGRVAQRRRATDHLGGNGADTPPTQCSDGEGHGVRLADAPGTGGEVNLTHPGERRCPSRPEEVIPGDAEGANGRAQSPELQVFAAPVREHGCATRSRGAPLPVRSAAAPPSQP